LKNQLCPWNSFINGKTKKGGTVMFSYPYLIELLSPKRSAGNQIEALLDRFAERYQRIIDAGCGVSIPDNPMGQPRLGALESFDPTFWRCFHSNND